MAATTTVPSRSPVRSARPASIPIPKKLLAIYIALFGLAWFEHILFLAASTDTFRWWIFTIDESVYTFMAWFIPAACVVVLVSHVLYLRRCVERACRHAKADAFDYAADYLESLNAGARQKSAETRQ